MLYMWVALIAMSIGGLLYESSSVGPDFGRAEAEAVSGNMAVYRNSVVPYAHANVGVTGVVTNAVLTLPTWYNQISGVKNYVSNGLGYVYYTTNQAQLAYLILKASNNSIHAGIKRSGYLVNPLIGVTPIALPAAIPDGSVVFADG